MTITIDDRREQLWQWDTGRAIVVTGAAAVEVHISRTGEKSARVVRVENGVAAIPDDLLTVQGQLHVYVVGVDDAGRMTEHKRVFTIAARQKPDDYVWGPEELKHWEQLEERIETLESNETTDHTKLTNRDTADQHPIGAITGLPDALDSNVRAALAAMQAAQDAGSAAGKAQSTADDAAAAAEKAQGSADKAQETADSATTAATELGKRLGAAEKELEGKQPAGDYLTSESDPTVPEWAKQPDKPTYTAAEVGALPSSTKIPSKTSELENDAEYAKTSELPQIDATLKQSGQAAEAAETGKRIEAISPDDSTIDGKPWSSKQIIDTLCPTLEETGNPSQCYPVVNYPLGIKVSWGPTQEGSGDPSPDNIRPISGRENVTLKRCGKNLMSFFKRIENETSKQIMSESELLALSKSLAGQNVTLTFTIETEDIVFADVSEEWRKRIGFEAEGKDTDGNAVYGLLCWVSERKNQLSTNGKQVVTVTTKMPALKSGSITFCAQNIQSGRFVAYDFGLFIGEGVSAYAPYTGQDTTLALPETIYGGEVDAVTGAGHKMWENIATYAGETLPSKWISDRDVYAVGATPTVGAQVVYKLAEPVSFEATGGQPVAALSGVNTVMTDAESVTVTGRADPIKRITDLEDAVASITTTEG